MPRRPMDSSCLWLPPVLAVRCTLLARPAPSDCKPSATLPRCSTSLQLLGCLGTDGINFVR